MSSVKISQLSKTYKKNGMPAVDNFDLEVEAGELVVLLGPSGCGKTTLLRCVAGLERPDSGRVTFGDVAVFDSISGAKDVPTHKRDIGMVFQNYALWPHMTVGRNVAYPMLTRGHSKAAVKAQVVKTLALVECEAYVDRFPSDLSGGQQQRIALARAMSANPAVLLFDEPLSNLDFRLRAQLRQDIRNLHRTTGFTGLYVTHDQTEALQVGDRVVVMRAGRPVQIGSPIEVFSRPATPYVARFLGINNSALLKFNGVTGHWQVADHPETAPTGLPARPDGFHELYVRSSDIELAPANTKSLGANDALLAEGMVQDVVYSGEHSEWIIDLGFGTWSATAAARTWPYKAGDRVAVTFDRDTALLYPKGQESSLSLDEKLTVTA